MALDTATLLRGREQGGWISLQLAEQTPIPPDLLPGGDGLMMSSAGSSGGRQVCLQPWCHLDRSAQATAAWLEEIGLDPADLLILNPLPLHHVSGLMPWWRSRCWGARYQVLSSLLMKRPVELLQFCEALDEWDFGSTVVSLVPTQLQRLLAHRAGVVWLQSCAVVWVGGSALPETVAELARRHGVRLAPCYGATETAAMVAAQQPEQFLAGRSGCGSPLADVELRLDDDGALMVRTARLAVARWSEQRPNQLQDVSDQDGWWRSGDVASLTQELRIQGRLDGAIQSGGETVFPEQLEARLMRWVDEHQIAVESVLLLGELDPEWGERLVALVRPRPAQTSRHDQLLKALGDGCHAWSAAERPRRWIICSDLAAGPLGKWQRGRWRAWLSDEGKRRHSG